VLPIDVQALMEVAVMTVPQFPAAQPNRFLLDLKLQACHLILALQ